MLTEEIDPANRIEVLAGGNIQVREARFVLRDGVRDPNIAPAYRRYVIEFGDDLTAFDERIAAVARAVWYGPQKA